MSELKKVREKLESGQTLEFQERRLLCNELMTREPRMEKLIVKWFDEEDYRTVLRHKVGDGVIGGKACGVLLARKLIKEKLPEYESLLLPHHSWFIGSDVFAEYLWEETFSERTKREFGELLVLMWFVPAAPWRMALTTHLPENTNLSSAPIRERKMSESKN